jgi:adenylosuccinate lyase
MIPRYSRQEMVQIFTDKNRFKIWFEIEAYALEAFEKEGLIEKGIADAVFKAVGDKKFDFDVDAILEIEKTTKHDVIAFLTYLAGIIGENSRFVHLGMTSSDILDTALAKQLDEASELLIADMEKLLEALKKRAFEHKNTICIGRSHGIHAEPTTFGLKMARFYAEFERGLKRLKVARQEIAVAAISGAVGTHANVSLNVQDHVASRLGLASEAISTQVIPRDRHAAFFATLGVIASSIENIATEIRHLQRTEVLEAEEFFAKGQKGSSAMPHKRNPILTENLCGLARIVRMSVVPALENVALWHERDISHSSVERMIAPDACVTLDFALNRLINVVENLSVYPKNMQKNIDKMGGLHCSQRVLLALIEQAKMSREEAYKITQENAMKVWLENADFKTLLKDDERVSSKLSSQKIDSLFDDSHHLKNVDAIFERVFG